MKSLMVTSSYPKFPGDATAPFIESIARGLAARGHAVDVVLPHHPELRRSADEPVRFFPYRYAPSDAWCRWGYAQSLEADVRVRREIYLLLPFVALALRGLVAERLRAERYDVVHVHWVVPNAVLVADVARAHGLPLVVSLHGSDVFLAERLPPARGLARRAFESAGSVTACSADLLRRALRLGSPAARSRVVPYGVDVEAFSPRATPAEAAGRLRATPGTALVVAVGRLVEKKGFRDLLSAAAATPDIEVAIAGEGDLRGALEAQARAAGTRVRFLGKLDRKDVAGVLAAADVVAVPSVVDDAGNVDGLPNVLLEALAAGRAVVATRVAGIPDVVQDGVNGVLVPERDPAALAAALTRLAREPETRARLGAAARHWAVERLGWDAAARAFEECYAQAAALDAA
jgi:glycosyltransferase involved in cell wall biosynthesis